ncbi:unnamed protein product [Blepharisma stoltei]|uniref:cAMP-dependent protein kinase catalytic subunit n=1 Tax=Blepharisma stoltei TaxID=1481888 RepID=A0AAU9KJ66_9CILI|nr:unnamed protein product [Blepharisma stoltei]
MNSQPPQIKEKFLDMPGYQLLHTLGKGAYGVVKLAKKENIYFAVKIFKKVEIIRKKQEIHIRNEMNISKTFNHPFVNNFISMHQDSRYIYFVVEYVPGGELYHLLRSSGYFELREARFYSAQVVVIFEYLHSKNIIYRDLKPENILINFDGYIKLVDFGFSKIVPGRTYTLCGTPNYMAPEVLLNQGHGKAVDWWAFGVFLYELLTGVDPFADDDTMEIFQNIVKVKLAFPRNFDRYAKSLIKHLLVKDLSKRYGNLKRGTRDIKNHRFFAGFDWQGLMTKQLPAPFLPPIVSPERNHSHQKYPDSFEVPAAMKKIDDPFFEW